MALLNKDQILGASDMVTRIVDVPEWGGAVCVRGLTGAELDAFEASMLKQTGKKLLWQANNSHARLAAYGIVDEQGARLFSNAEIEALAKKSGSALKRVYEVVRELSGLSEKDVEELEKNSAGDLSDASISG